MYELIGRAHTALMRERGQGTVEYVGLILLIAVVVGGLVAAGSGLAGGDAIASTIVKKLKDAIESVNID
jgi:hypothetical protein